MQVRTRLIIAFFLMLICPIAIMSIFLSYTLDKKSDEMSEYYHLVNNDDKQYDFLLNPVNVLTEVTLADYNYICKIINNDPSQLMNETIVAKINSNLQDKDSYLVLEQVHTPYYIGNEEHFSSLSSLSSLTDGLHRENRHLTYLDQPSNSIIRECTFTFEDGSCGQALIITDYSHLQPLWSSTISESLIAFFLILFTTAIVLILWIYQGIVRPLGVLRLAAAQIGAGNLDIPIKVTSKDEIGQLCQDFEDMRIRLKNMVEKSIRSEDNTRQIMSSISHDLKTPITAIKGYAEGILDGVADTEERKHKYLQTIYAKANDITYLIDELSIFSKMEQNSLAYNFISVPLEDYFADCIEDLSLDLESQNIAIEYRNSTNINTHILADPEQLKRVLNNLIGNAAKYMDKPSGKVTITIDDVPDEPAAPQNYRQLNEDGTALVIPNEPAADSFVQIMIQDNGPGISEADLPHIFERFFRADTSRNSAKRGSGLGLSIVSLIIADHGGNIWVKSTLGEGSRFYFTLKKTNEKES